MKNIIIFFVVVSTLAPAFSQEQKKKQSTERKVFKKALIAWKNDLASLKKGDASCKKTIALIAVAAKSRTFAVVPNILSLSKAAQRSDIQDLAAVKKEAQETHALLKKLAAGFKYKKAGAKYGLALVMGLYNRVLNNTIKLSQALRSSKVKSIDNVFLSQKLVATLSVSNRTEAKKEVSLLKKYEALLKSHLVAFANQEILKQLESLSTVLEASATEQKKVTKALVFLKKVASKNKNGLEANSALIVSFVEKLKEIDSLKERINLVEDSSQGRLMSPWAYAQRWVSTWNGEDRALAIFWFCLIVALISWRRWRPTYAGTVIGDTSKTQTHNYNAVNVAGLPNTKDRQGHIEKINKGEVEPLPPTSIEAGGYSTTLAKELGESIVISGEVDTNNTRMANQEEFKLARSLGCSDLPTGIGTDDSSVHPVDENVNHDEGTAEQLAP